MVELCYYDVLHYMFGVDFLDLEPIDIPSTLVMLMMHRFLMPSLLVIDAEHTLIFGKKTNPSQAETLAKRAEILGN